MESEPQLPASHSSSDTESIAALRAQNAELERQLQQCRLELQQARETQQRSEFSCNNLQHAMLASTIICCGICSTIYFPTPSNILLQAARFRSCLPVLTKQFAFASKIRVSEFRLTLYPTCLIPSKGQVTFSIFPELDWG